MISSKNFAQQRTRQGRLNTTRGNNVSHELLQHSRPKTETVVVTPRPQPHHTPYRIGPSHFEEAYEGEHTFREAIKVDLDHLAEVVDAARKDRTAIQKGVLEVNTRLRDLSSTILDPEHETQLPDTTLNSGTEKKCRELHQMLQRSLRDIEEKRNTIDALQRELEWKEAQVAELTEQLRESETVRVQLEAKIVLSPLEVSSSSFKRSAHNTKMENRGSPTQKPRQPTAVAGQIAAPPVTLKEGPKGKVTIVYAEIQGAAKLWEDHPAEMKMAHATTARIVRSEIEKANGYEVRAPESAFMAVFAEASDAVRFGLVIQQSLMTAEWSDVFDNHPDTMKKMEGFTYVWKGVRLQIGMHIGIPVSFLDPVSGRTDYFGPVANIATCIARLGLGGAVAVTKELKDAVTMTKFPDGLAPSFVSLKSEGPVSLFMILSKSLLGRRGELEKKGPHTVPGASLNKWEAELRAKAPTGKVCLVDLRVQGVHGIEGRDASLWKRIHAIYSFEVHTQSAYSGGFISVEEEDRFLVSFPSTNSAVDFALKIQEHLMFAEWPAALLSLPMAKPHEVGDTMIYRGLRIMCGIHTSSTTVEFDARSRTLRYIGAEASVSKQLCAMTRAGEIVLTDAVLNTIDGAYCTVVEPKTEYIQEETFPNAARPFKLYRMFPRSLEKRLAVLGNTSNPGEISFDVVNEEAAAAALRSLLTRFPTGRLVCVCGDVEAAKTIADTVPKEIFEQVRRLILEAVAHSSKRFRGTLVKVDSLAFMVVFYSAREALHWVSYLQVRLLSLSYPWQFLSAHELCREGRSPENNNNIIWNGARLRMGMHRGLPICTVNEQTKAAEYKGMCVAKAVAAAMHAAGGQIVVTEEIHDDITQHLTTLGNVIVTDLGVVQLEAPVGQTHLYSVLPEKLKGRLFYRKPLPADNLKKFFAQTEVFARPPDPLAPLTRVRYPTGLVTLVFTDVQNAAGLKADLGEDYSEALDIYTKCVRDNLEAFQGYEVRLDNDSFLLAFSSRQKAVLWCVHVQIALSKIPNWPQSLEAKEDPKAATGDGQPWKGLRVRMGAHTGTPMLELDPVTMRVDYWGPPVAQTAKVTAYARGGEIVISADTLSGLDASQAPYATRNMGPRKLGTRAEDTVVLHSILPTALIYRRYKELKEKDFPNDEARVGRLAKMESTLQCRNSALDVPPRNYATFVFADVQGKDVLEQQCREAKGDIYHKALELYVDALRDALGLCHGHEVKTDENGGFMVAFHTVLDALNWCQYVQRSLLYLAWPKELLKLEDAKVTVSPESELLWRGLRVHMGVHTGECYQQVNPSTSKIEYYGNNVNVAVRIMGVGRGGDILLSHDAILEISDLKALGFPIVTALGERHVKGVQEGIKMYRVTPQCLQGRAVILNVPRVVSPGEGQNEKVWWQPQIKKSGELTASVEEDDDTTLVTLHRNVRHYFLLMQTFLDPLSHNMTTSLSPEEFISKWVAVLRTKEGADPRSMRNKSNKKKSSREELSDYLRQLLDSEADEKSHAGNPSKLAKSLIGHATRHFIYVGRMIMSVTGDDSRKDLFAMEDPSSQPPGGQSPPLQSPTTVQAVPKPPKGTPSASPKKQSRRQLTATYSGGF